jgi:phosphoglycolate phosphatase-like HAD superfamily hydrolase
VVLQYLVHESGGAASYRTSGWAFSGVSMTEVLQSDIDGTLVDSNALHAEAWRRAFEHFGIEVGLDQTRSQIGRLAIRVYASDGTVTQQEENISIDRRCAPRPAKFQSRRRQIFKARLMTNLRRQVFKASNPFPAWTSALRPGKLAT